MTLFGNSKMALFYLLEV